MEVRVPKLLAIGELKTPIAIGRRGTGCCALANVTDEPLLFKGEDFARTDIESA